MRALDENLFLVSPSVNVPLSSAASLLLLLSVVTSSFRKQVKHYYASILMLWT